MPQPNQLYVRAEGAPISAADLLSMKGVGGSITTAVWPRPVVEGHCL
jgi:hypothetical protein